MINPTVGMRDHVSIDGFPFTLVPGQYRVITPPRFGEKLSIGPLKYADFNPYETPWDITSLHGGYGLQRYSDLEGIPASRLLYKESSNVDCREAGVAVLSPLQIAETLPGVTGSPVWLGEFTTGGTTYWVCVAGRGVYSRNADGTWTLRITLPAAARQGAVVVSGPNLIFGYGAANRAQYTANLAALTNITSGGVAFYAFALAADRAAVYAAGGTATTNVNTVLSSADDGATFATSVTCGSSDSTINGLAPGGGLATVYVGKQTEIGLIDNAGVYRVLVPMDSRLTTNCLLGSTKIGWRSYPQGITRRWFDGEIIEITTAGNRILSGTPNHPVSTRRGWAPLGLLSEGDDVLVGSLRHLGLGGTADEHDMNATLEQIFEAAVVEGATLERRAVTPVDFHGDGQQGEVQVIALKGNLLNKRIATASKLLANRFLHSANLQKDDLLGHGPAPKSLLGVMAAPTKSACPIKQVSPLILRHARHPQSLGLRHRSGPNVQFAQHSPNDCQGHSILDSHLRRRRSVVVEMNKLRLVWREPTPVPEYFQPWSDRNTKRCQNVPHRLSMKTEPQCELAETHPAAIESDKVVSIRRRQFSGHVYNLQTSSGDYYANGIITHNCQVFRWYLGTGNEQVRGPQLLVFSRDRELWIYQPSTQDAGTADNISPWAHTGLRPPNAHGNVTAATGTARWLYYAITNDDTGNTWLVARDARSGASHTLLSLGANSCRAIGVTSLFGTNPQLFYAVGNNVYRSLLPLAGDAPDGPGLFFATSGTLDLPEIDLGFPDEIKSLFAVRVIGDGFMAGQQYVDVTYALDGATTYTSLGTAYQSPFTEIPFPVNTTARRIALRLAFTTGDVAKTPTFRGLVFRMSIVPRLYRIWQIQVMKPGGSTALLSDDTYNPQTVIDTLWNDLEQGTTIPFIDRWNTTWNVRILDFVEQEAIREPDRVPESILNITLLQHSRAGGALVWDGPAAIWDQVGEFWGTP